MHIVPAVVLNIYMFVAIASLEFSGVFEASYSYLYSILYGSS